MKIIIRNIVGSDILTDAADAYTIRNHIVECAKRGPVEVSFANMRIIVLHPLHIFIGTLYSPEYVHLVDNITFVDVSADHAYLIQRVSDNAKIFYADPTNYEVKDAN